MRLAFWRKPEISKIHLLVHPFFGVTDSLHWEINAEGKAVPRPWYKTYKTFRVDTKRYEKALSRQWSALVRRIKENRDEVLVYVPIHIQHARSDRLLSFARKKLGKRLIVAENITLNEARKVFSRVGKLGKLDMSKVALEAHGEMAKGCSHIFLHKMGEASGNAELYSQAVGAVNYLNPEDRILRETMRATINPETTEILEGRERFIKKHSWRKPKVRPTRKSTFRKRRYRANLRA